MKNRILLQRIGYTVAGLACITIALDWRAALAAFGAMLILRRMLITLGAHLGSFALAHFRPDQVLPPEDVFGSPSTFYSAGRKGLEQLRQDLAAKGARFIEVRIGSARSAERMRVERPGPIERPQAAEAPPSEKERVA